MEEIKACRRCGRPGKIKDTFVKFRRGWVGCPACSLYINWQIDPAGAVKKMEQAETIEIPKLRITPKEETE